MLILARSNPFMIRQIPEVVLITYIPPGIHLEIVTNRKWLMTCLE